MNRQQQFYKVMQAGLQELNIRENTTSLSSMYPQILATQYGDLLIDVDQVKDSRNARTYTCYARFIDVDKAKEHLDCNPFSGKWNFHFLTKDSTPEEIAKDILKSIRSIV